MLLASLTTPTPNAADAAAGQVTKQEEHVRRLNFFYVEQLPAVSGSRFVAVGCGAASTPHGAPSKSGPARAGLRAAVGPAGSLRKWARSLGTGTHIDIFIFDYLGLYQTIPSSQR